MPKGCKLCELRTDNLGLYSKGTYYLWAKYLTLTGFLCLLTYEVAFGLKYR